MDENWRADVRADEIRPAGLPEPRTVEGAELLSQHRGRSGTVKMCYLNGDLGLCSICQGKNTARD
jgi:hypothetical protein